MKDKRRDFVKRPTVRWLIAASAIVLGSIFLVNREHSSRSRVHPVRAVTPLLDQGLAQTTPPVAETKSPILPPAQPARLRPAPSRAVSPEIAEAFPQLVELPRDWRDFRPDTITVAPHPDLPLTFTKIAVKNEGRSVTWIGRNAQMPGASFVGVATANGYDAILVLAGASQFSFHVRGEAMVVAESAPGEESCGDGPVQVTKGPLADGPTMVEVNYVAGFNPDAAILAATAPLYVDVLFAYDSTTLTTVTAQSSDPAGYLEGQCKAMIETANVALSQSGVTAFAWRFVACLPAPTYTRTGDIADDLKALAPGGTLASWVKSNRYQRGADQVMLIVGTTKDFYGRAYSNQQTAISADQAVAVMFWGGSTQTMEHELAHNFGCQHDRAHINVTALNQYGAPVPDNDGFWCYGQMWQNSLPAPYVGDPGTGGTIMSYADWRIPYFSNPNITVRLTGSLLGWGVNPDLGPKQLGVSETAVGAAYNAKVLNDQALTMSNNSQEIGTPAITIQPQATSVTKGQSFTLSVTATGGGLSYQWLKAGVAITGAQDSSYSKTADAPETDTYSVKVSNLSGSLTSNPVAVTVTAPVAPSSGGGGGGGGGMFTGWFLGCFSLLGLMRWILRRT